MDDFLSVEKDGIVISARSAHLGDSGSSHLWGYYLCIENNSDSTIQILGKDWNITDDSGNSFHDDSAGFRGEIPELEPGEYFEFTSEAPLKSSNAVFYGSCKIASESGIKDVKIPTFLLSTDKDFTLAS
jgi:ApaG protein